MFDHVTALAALGLGIFSFIGQYRWKSLPKWISDTGLIIAGIFAGLAIYPVFVRPEVNPMPSITELPKVAVGVSSRPRSKPTEESTAILVIPKISDYDPALLHGQTNEELRKSEYDLSSDVSNLFSLYFDRKKSKKTNATAAEKAESRLEADEWLNRTTRNDLKGPFESIHAEMNNRLRGIKGNQNQFAMPDLGGDGLLEAGAILQMQAILDFMAKRLP